MYSAPLYNAVRQESSSRISGETWIWPSIILHGADKLFAGDRSKKPEDYLKRLDPVHGLYGYCSGSQSGAQTRQQRLRRALAPSRIRSSSPNHFAGHHANHGGPRSLHISPPFEKGLKTAFSDPADVSI